MEIIINQNNIPEYIIETSKIRWKLYSKKIKLILLLLFSAGVLFLAAGLNEDFEHSTSSSKSVNNSIITYTSITKYNYHIILGLGVSWILLSIYIAYILLIRQKKSFLKAKNKISERHKLISSRYTIKINDQFLYYQDSETTREEKWSIFLKYKVYKEYLFLFRDDFFLTTFVIDKRQMSEKEFADLLDFVKSKLSEKK